MNIKIGTDTLNILRERGGNWAVYQNQAMDSAGFGDLKFLKFGPGCTFHTPPKPRLPDTPTQINWKYIFIGELNMEKECVSNG